MRSSRSRCSSSQALVRRSRPRRSEGRSGSCSAESWASSSSSRSRSPAPGSASSRRRAFLIAAQFGFAAAIDRYGWFGVERVATTWPRLARHRPPPRGRRAHAAPVTDHGSRARAPARLEPLPRADAHPAAAEAGGASAGARARLGAERGFDSPSTTRATSSSAFPRPRVATALRRSSSRHTWTWSANGIRSSPNDPRAGRIDVVRDGDWVSPGHDARRGQRHRSRGCDGGGGGPGDRARPARAALHGVGGARARRREGARSRARLRSPPRQPRRDERRRADGRLRRQRPHVHAIDLRRRAGSARPRRSRACALGREGGHSGGDIAAGGSTRSRRSAGSSRATSTAPFRLCSLDGGVSRNAIPREARATVALAPEAEPAFRRRSRARAATVAEQYADSDGGLALAFEPSDAAEAASAASTERVLELLAAHPDAASSR